MLEKYPALPGVVPIENQIYENIGFLVGVSASLLESKSPILYFSNTRSTHVADDRHKFGEDRQFLPLS